MTSQLSCHTQNFVAITLIELGCEQNEISLNLNYDGIVVHEMPGAQVGPLQWRHTGPDGVSNHQPYDCLLNRLFRRR